jgi:hypothetical protein
VSTIHGSAAASLVHLILKAIGSLSNSVRRLVKFAAAVEISISKILLKNIRFASIYGKLAEEQTITSAMSSGEIGVCEHYRLRHDIIARRNPARRVGPQTKDPKEACHTCRLVALRCFSPQSNYSSTRRVKSPKVWFSPRSSRLVRFSFEPHLRPSMFHPSHLPFLFSTKPLINASEIVTDL